MSKANKYSHEVRERAVRLVQEARKDRSSLWSAVESIAPMIGCSTVTLHEWVKKHEIDTGVRDGIPTAERERIKALEREDKELRLSNEILRLVSAFRPGRVRPPQEEERAFIDRQRERFGVEPISKLLQVAPFAYWRHTARQRDPALLIPQARRDAFLIPHIQRVWQANFQGYGADKVWRQLLREGIQVARCTVERLMRLLDLRGVRRGKVVRTTFGDTAAPCPQDRVNRQFKTDRPNQRWVSDFTYVSTWAGFVYVAFVIDVFARRIVGWRVSRSMRTDFVLDALEQALYARRPERDSSLIHHSNRGSQYVSIRYTERLAEAGIKERLFEPIGHIPPAEAEERYYLQLTVHADQACIEPWSLYETRGNSSIRKMHTLKSHLELSCEI